MTVLTYLSTVKSKTTKHLGLNFEILFQASPADFFLWLFCQYVVNWGDCKDLEIWFVPGSASQGKTCLTAYELGV